MEVLLRASRSARLQLLASFLNPTRRKLTQLLSFTDLPPRELHSCGCGHRTYYVCHCSRSDAVLERARREEILFHHRLRCSSSCSVALQARESKLTPSHSPSRLLLTTCALFPLQATTNHSDPGAFVHSSTAFFVLVSRFSSSRSLFFSDLRFLFLHQQLITFELIVCTLLLVFPITVMFPSERARRRWENENIESGGRVQYQNPQIIYNQPPYAPRPSY